MAAVALRALGFRAFLDASDLSLVVDLVDPVVVRSVETGPAGRAPAHPMAPAQRERRAPAPDGPSRTGLPPAAGQASAPSVGESARATAPEPLPEPPRPPPVAREPAVDRARSGPVTESPSPGRPPAPRAALPPTGRAPDVPPVIPRRPLGEDPAPAPTAGAGLPAPPSPAAPAGGDSRRVTEPGGVVAASSAGAPGDIRGACRGGAQETRTADTVGQSVACRRLDGNRSARHHRGRDTIRREGCRSGALHQLRPLTDVQ